MSADAKSPLGGGCQCGAVRYSLRMEPERSHYCHCRMCQRATGNLFAALAGSHKDKLEWSGAPPAFFASSTLAQRGFCPRCGTPLSFSYNDSEWIYVTIGSLDDPARAKPGMHFGVESQVPWLHIEDGLKREPTQDNDKLRAMTVFQFGGASSHG
ncbi:MAG TPA: GFA family protein [Solimonas sp.]|nr:GFA family protein [Solimonas sp.]